MYQRIDKINALLRQEISLIIAQEISDPRVSFTVSVVNVETSRGLGIARVYVTVLGDVEHTKKSLEGLNSASNFIRRSLMKKIIVVLSIFLLINKKNDLLFRFVICFFWSKYCII